MEIFRFKEAVSYQLSAVSEKIKSISPLPPFAKGGFKKVLAES
jgi:hypothetical protein